MRRPEFDLKDEAFAFIDRLGAIGTREGVLDAMADSLGALGFEHFILTGLPSPQQRVEQLFMASRWPPHWVSRYVALGYAAHDPVLHRCWSTVNPFEWTEVAADAGRSGRAATVMREAAEHGLAHGFTLPIHGAAGFEACLSMAGGPALAIPQGHRPALHLMGYYAFERLRALLPARPATTRLTAREREVLVWSANGKSAGEVAAILGITERTVTAHVANAAGKLGAVNKTQAVARAVQQRLIHL